LKKDEDAFKAMASYLKKTEVSKICRANLLKAHAILILIRSKVKYDEIGQSVDLLKKASKLFQELGIKKGVALCKFGLAKVYED